MPRITGGVQTIRALPIYAYIKLVNWCKGLQRWLLHIDQSMDHGRKGYSWRAFTQGWDGKPCCCCNAVQQHNWRGSPALRFTCKIEQRAILKDEWASFWWQIHEVMWQGTQIPFISVPVQSKQASVLFFWHNKQGKKTKTNTTMKIWAIKLGNTNVLVCSWQHCAHWPGRPENSTGKHSTGFTLT